MTNQTEAKTYFSVVVPSGSTCGCRRVRNFSENCGHKHRTEEAAEKCREKLAGFKDGSCSATWYNARTVEFDRSNDGEIRYDFDGNAQNADDACTC